LAVVIASLLLLAPACASDAHSRSTPAGPAAVADPRLAGSLTVFAAASLTETFDDDKARLAPANPALSLTFSYAGSQQLVAQITAGAPADVVATADGETMGRLVTAGLVDPPITFASNSLRIVVAKGNPKGVRALSDLARTNLTVILADRSVPAGRYAQQALDRAGAEVKAASLELDVKAVVRKVASGEADAGLVYATDVAAAGSSVVGIDIPPEHNVVATYPVAVVRATKSRPAGQAFVDQLLHGPGRDALEAHGFLGP
jgi:molybdate transport system substrate-binding protein